MLNPAAFLQEPAEASPHFYFVYALADEGIGIAAHLQPVLFVDKFTPARRPGLRG